MTSLDSSKYSESPTASFDDYVADNKMPPLRWIVDPSMKAGEIYRNENGQYSFMCFHCGCTFQDVRDVTDHVDTHFEANDVKWEIDEQTQEFDHYTYTKPDVSPILEPEILNVSTPLGMNSKMQAQRNGRKIKRKKFPPMLDIPQYCPICGLWCDDFRDHLKTHGYKDRIYQCFICRTFFKTFERLQQHISSTIHTKVKCYHCEMEPPVTKPSDPRRHKCLFCKQWYLNHFEFKIHFKEAHNKNADYFFHKRSNCNIFTCYVCEREFPLRYYLAAHMKTHHEKFLRHQCPTCGRRVRTFGQLTQHLKTHESKTYKCDQCDKVFPFYARLRIHKQTHKTELNYKCDICSKAFKVSKYLNQHMAVHRNNKKFACRFCGVKFNFSSGRRAHEKGQHKAM